ncbi:hypothetical protein OG511_42360 [Streptomyces sp. NBC_01453]|uniref:hypothetical protein n=1 Tax=Streptomyces sp. NBC_01453 TaxID=2903873 RepID=UPI002E2CBDFA|nr:hypothetical protein [Streptomyces sp. NBC_01453]
MSSLRSKASGERERLWGFFSQILINLTTTGNASSALLTRDLVIYPETVALARALATLPNRPHRTIDDALSLIAHRLNLTRLTPSANDPLRVFLTHTRHRPATPHSEARRKRSRL